MDKADLESYISFLLSEYSAQYGIEIQDIKVKTARQDTLFLNGSSYIVEITEK